MKQIVSIGELLIDFIPGGKGKSLQNIQTFHKLPGGAPANVCVQASKLYLLCVIQVYKKLN